MRKLFILLLIITGFFIKADAQFIHAKFGKGLQVIGKDSTFHMKFGMRFQNLFSNEWELEDGFKDYSSNFLIRRSRFKFNGWVLNPNVKWKFEMGLSNRDVSGGGAETRGANRLILDAYIDWKFHKNFSLKIGQGKLPGNRERVVSSGNLQFVDRSRLNSRYNIDRDFGLHLKHQFKIGENFIVQEIVALTQGEGRNITEGNFGANDYTFRLELLPFGKFQSKGDYVGSAIKRESKPKLGLGFTYDINQKAARERGQNGSFIPYGDDFNYGKDLNTFFADAMFKYEGFSFMGEYAFKQTADKNPEIMVDGLLVGTYYTGTGLNLQAGYLMDNNWEVAVRYTTINPDDVVASDEQQYTLGFSRYIVGHKLKVQTDFTLRSRPERNDNFIWRTQVDLHF